MQNRIRPIDEHNLLEAKLVEFAREGDYDTKRKISRALPYLYEVDKSMTVELIEILREDLYVIGQFTVSAPASSGMLMRAPLESISMPRLDSPSKMTPLPSIFNTAMLNICKAS